jgi:hypothetical protein
MWALFEILSRIFYFQKNLTRIMDTWHEDQRTFMTISRSVLLRMTNVSNKSCRENQNKHFLFSNFLCYQKSCRLWHNVDKYCRAWEATGYNVAHAHLALVNWSYKHTLGICNTYCFSTSRMTARTCLYFTLYIHCLSCLSILCVPCAKPVSFSSVWSS